MSTKKPSREPALVHHKATDQDCIFLRENGKRRAFYLGKHGTAEAQKRYQEVLDDIRAGRSPKTASAAKQLIIEAGAVAAARQALEDAAKPNSAKPATWPTLHKLCALFLEYADGYYRNSEGELSKGV